MIEINQKMNQGAVQHMPFFPDPPLCIVHPDMQNDIERHEQILGGSLSKISKYDKLWENVCKKVEKRGLYC